MQDDPKYFKTFCHMTSLKGDKLNYGHKKNCSRDNIEPNKLHDESCHSDRFDTSFILTNGWQIIRSEIFAWKI